MLLQIAGVIIIAIGAFLLNKANRYGKQVRAHVNDPATDMNNRGADHWQQVETSRSATNMFIYAIGIIIVGAVIVAARYIL